MYCFYNKLFGMLYPNCVWKELKTNSIIPGGVEGKKKKKTPPFFALYLWFSLKNLNW